MQIDLSILVSIAVGLCTIITFIKTSEKNRNETNNKIDVLRNDVKHLSEKVEKHNQMVERTYKLEQETAVLKEEMKVEQHRTQDLEEGLEKANDKITNLGRRNGI